MHYSLLLLLLLLLQICFNFLLLLLLQLVEFRKKHLCFKRDRTPLLISCTTPQPPHPPPIPPTRSYFLEIVLRRVQTKKEKEGGDQYCKTIS